MTFPPWAIEDEQQHVDYVWKIAFDHQVPTIEDEIDYAIVEGVFGTDRFAAYDMATPAPTAESMGLQARSYAAYHPPGVYLVLAPPVAVLGERALLVLYALRLASAVAAGAVAVVAALLAADVARAIAGRNRPAGALVPAARRRGTERRGRRRPDRWRGLGGGTPRRSRPGSDRAGDGVRRRRPARGRRVGRSVQHRHLRHAHRGARVPARPGVDR